MNRTKSKLFISSIISIAVLAAAFIISLCNGAEAIPFAAVFGRAEKFQSIILWQVRLPRSLLVLLTGILLGGSGAVFQMFFRNPLAEPGIMGISSGATLGAVIASIIPFTASLSKAPGIHFISPVNLFAFAGAIGAGAIVTFLAFSKAGKNSSVMLLLCGTALGTLYSSVSSMILLTSNKELYSIYTWILGSFNGRSWNELLFILIPSAISIIIMLAICNPLDVLAGGETAALSLGVNVNRLRILVLVAGGLAVSAAVCAGGTISFVGLIAPHIVRKVISPKGKALVPFSMIFGAILLLLSDTLARVLIAPAELPAGIITAILGVPFFLSLCLGKNR